ncbi:MAG TPA: class I SAM-dependent methyltransferase [Kofleriaceae bacterium]
MTTSDKIETTDEVCEYLQIPYEQLRAPLQRLQAASVAHGNSPHADLMRMDVCHRIRLAQDRVFAAGTDPVPEYARVISDAAAQLESSSKLPLADSVMPPDDSETPQDATANHYGALWGGFSPDHYFDEATALLRARLERNGFDLAKVSGMRVLDGGCGGGRYSVALKRLGFGEVVGVDWSKQGIAVANERVKQAKIAGVSYQQADVLKLPFADGEFDFVFSNGVLHHTYDTQRGIAELRRVTKPGGAGWLYLYHRPGGLDRLTHYVARLLLKRANKEVCRRYCNALGLAANRIFFLLDLWLTPIAECYTPDEMSAMMKEAGFTSWRRCARGADQDLAEHIYQREPFAEAKYGVGENRYFIDA